MKKLNEAKKILILGDAGRGKTTMAEKLSKKLGLPSYSTDDFFWKIKFSEANSNEYMVSKAKEAFNLPEWIVEGGSHRMIEHGVDKADLIINLEFSNIFSQYKSIIKRNKTRSYENFGQMLRLLKYVTLKRFSIGMNKAKEREELLEQYKHKVISLKSYKEINEFIGNLQESNL